MHEKRIEYTNVLIEGKLLKWFTPFEILKMSTSNAGELLKLCGPRNSYPGDLGVVKEGA